MDLSTRELFELISKQLGVPSESMERFIAKLEGEFIMKAEQLAGFSVDTLHKDLGLPIGIAVKIQEILSKPSVKKSSSTPKPRKRARGLSVTQEHAAFDIAPLSAPYVYTNKY